MKITTICQQLQSLAQETRLRIFRKLITCGEQGMCAGDICKALDVSCNSLSFHLNHLSNAGLISSKRDGRYIIYSCNYTAAKALTDYLSENCCGGGPCNY